MSRIASVVVLVALVLVPASAYADKWTSADEHKDVAGLSYSPDPSPCGTVSDVDATSDANEDITGLTVRHAARTVRLKARFRDLDPGKEQSVWFHLRTPDREWEVDVQRFQKPSGDFRVFGFVGALPEDAGRADCAGSGVLVMDLGGECGIHPEVDLDADVVRARISRECLDDPRWVRVGLEAHGWTEPEDPADRSLTVYSDDWGARGAFGARVLPTGGH